MGTTGLAGGCDVGCMCGEPRGGEQAADEGSREAPDVVGYVGAAQEGHVLLPARSEAAGGEGVAEAAQVAGEVVLRSRVRLCDRAAHQGAVSPGCAALTTVPKSLALHLKQNPCCSVLPRIAMSSLAFLNVAKNLTLRGLIIDARVLRYSHLR